MYRYRNMQNICGYTIQEIFVLFDKMVEFQKILVGIYIAMQIGVQVYIYFCETGLAAFGQDGTPNPLLSILPYIILSVCILILFIILTRKNPGRIVVENHHKVDIDDDISEQEGQNPNNHQQNAFKVNNKEQIGTQRAIMAVHLDNKQVANPKISKADQKNSYCYICQIYQPYRTKHCHECDSCIATFDHHCPWMNNCIGQKNRHLYYIFLLLQLVQAFLVSIRISSYAINFLNGTDQCFAGILSITLIFFSTLTLILFVFHTFLMMKNLTTWQFIKKDHIGYMNQQLMAIANKQKQQQTYSPFCKGTLNNIRQFWGAALSVDRKIWQLCHQRN